MAGSLCCTAVSLSSVLVVLPLYTKDASRLSTCGALEPGRLQSPDGRRSAPACCADRGVRWGAVPAGQAVAGYRVGQARPRPKVVGDFATALRIIPGLCQRRPRPLSALAGSPPGGPQPRVR